MKVYYIIKIDDSEYLKIRQLENGEIYELVTQDLIATKIRSYNKAVLIMKELKKTFNETIMIEKRS